MGIKEKIDSEISKFQKADDEHDDLESKLDEVLELLARSKLDSEVVKTYKEKLDSALEKATTQNESISSFRKLAADDSLSREQLLDRMGLLLSESKIDSKTAKKIVQRKLGKRITLAIIAVVAITLGFGMIVMPAPSAEFEIYTIFHFTPEDGVTIMDLISLLIILCGVFLLIVSFNGHKTDEHGQ